MMVREILLLKEKSNKNSSNNDSSLVWRCSKDQAIDAIKKGIAHPTDFIIVEKFTFGLCKKYNLIIMVILLH